MRECLVCLGKFAQSQSTAHAIKYCDKCVGGREANTVSPTNANYFVRVNGFPKAIIDAGVAVRLEKYGKLMCGSDKRSRQHTKQCAAK